jgi:putative CocE/NonD family hydrolase
MGAEMMVKKVSEGFFSEEKKQKTVVFWGRLCPQFTLQETKVFWFFFSRKNILAFLSSCCFTVAAAQTPPMAPFWAKRLTGYLPAADGTRLRYSVLLPPGAGPFPVLINYSGYDPGVIGSPPYLREDTAMSPSLDRTLVQQGYAVMGVSARGTGCSQGKFDFLGPAYGLDGRDAVEFAAAQAWSDGRVGMVNWSWAGMSQLATASDRPPHLRAIAPGMVLGDPRLDSWYPGGVPAPAFINDWRDFLHQRWQAVREAAGAENDQSCLAQLARNFAYEDQEPITRQVFRHPLRDDWIGSRVLRDRTHLIDVPVLSMESFQDEAVTSREGYYQETLDPDKVWMLQTNGGHDLYDSLAFRPLLLAFLDHFVKGLDNGFQRRPHLTVWMDTSTDASAEPAASRAAKPGWAFTWPSITPTVAPLRLALHAGGLLASGIDAGGAPDHFAYPVPGPTIDAGFDRGIWGKQPNAWQSGSLAYTSSAFAQDQLAYGSASADLWVSSTLPDFDLQVTLTDVRPDGQEMFVQRGWLRVSDRNLNTTRSTPLRPVLADTVDSIQPLDPGRPVLARVEIDKFSFVFRKSDRIRLWIDTPSQSGGYGFSYISLPGTNTIWHDTAHPSALVLGMVAGVPIAGAAPRCGTPIKEPCRLDPVH